MSVFPTRRSRVGPSCVLALAGALALVSGVQAQPPLTLRVNDATVRPSHEAAVVLRTYASRPLDQGQVCLRAPMVATTGPGQPLMTLREAVVWSALGDTVFDVRVDFDVDPPAIILTFRSPSGTINTSDGPLAALFFDVDPSVPVGTELPVALDLDQTVLIGNDGLPIVIHAVDGDVEVVSQDAPFVLEAEGDQTEAGQPLVVGASFEESRRIRQGRVGLILPPALASRPFTVTIDPRFGTAIWSVDETTPGRLDISFESPDETLGRIPGQFLRVSIDSAGVPAGIYPIALDPVSTFLVDHQGTQLPIELEADEAVVVGDGFFLGDFETGDFSGWSAVIVGD